MSDTKLFANDMKVYRVSGLLGKTWKSYRKIFLTWTWSINDWQLKFNTDKCEAMRISKNNDYSSPQYHLCGNQLEAVEPKPLDSRAIHS